MKPILPKIATVLCLLIASSIFAFAIRAPEVPLEKRVEAAEKVFVGKVINKKVDGEWVRAELLVESPLRNAEKEARIPVIWRRELGDLKIYDVTVGSKGVALLLDKHEGRYWLGYSRFEKLDKMEEIEKLIEKFGE